MSNQLSAKVEASLTDDGVTLPVPIVAWLATAEHFEAGRMTLSTSNQQVPNLSLSGSIGGDLLIIWNTSATVGEYLILSNGDPGTPIARVYPGEFHIFRPWAPSLLYIKSAAGTPVCRFWLLENA